MRLPAGSLCSSKPLATVTLSQAQASEGRRERRLHPAQRLVSLAGKKLVTHSVWKVPLTPVSTQLRERPGQTRALTALTAELSGTQNRRSRSGLFPSAPKSSRVTRPPCSCRPAQHPGSPVVTGAPGSQLLVTLPLPALFSLGDRLPRSPCPFQLFC